MSESSEPLLLSPIRLRQVTLRNRVVVSPMCMYSAQDGLASDFHFVHLGRFALGGAGLVMVEASAVQAEGRITHGDMGIWNDEQRDALARIARFVADQGAVPGIQLAHAGRKGSMQRPWFGNGPLDAQDAARGDLPWPILGPVAKPHDEGWLMPKAMTLADIEQLKADFRAAAVRANQAGFKVVELHGAHGYLMHSFLSPLVNRRSDGYGGDMAGRMRLLLEVAQEVRAVWPQDRPLFVRISAVDGVDDGWSLDDSVVLARELKQRGVDVIDCSSGGIGAPATAGSVPRAYGFQSGFAARIKREAQIATMAVGLIVDPRQAQQILANGEADLIAVARQMLQDPNWAVGAQLALKSTEPASARFAAWPEQYGWWLQRRATALDKLGPWRSEDQNPT
jgi:2,4-dienoyl-CoA reductase-like NADH-dependent reductase (Old Yellow Enzyme family)